MSRLAPAGIATRWHAFRQLGPRQGTAAAMRKLVHAGRGRYWALRIERRPVRTSAAELQIALGGRSLAAALHAARSALPTVAVWDEQLERLAPEATAQLLACAQRLMAHEFDLLGSGPVGLGPDIDWQADFKTGRRWPARHISKLPIVYPDASDIKVPWELSRAQHLPLLSAAFRLTGQERYLDEVGAQIQSWIAANPVEIGVNWACTMDVGIRAVNWLAALALVPEPAATRDWAQPVLISLLQHARFIRGHLEFGSARGNHYLSDIVGLLVCAAPFSASPEGRRWIDWATQELASEMAHQVREDGCDHEASISYHRLVAELFIVGADAAQALAPGLLDPAVPRGIAKMLDFVADYTRPDGLAPQIGDADDGRLLPLGDYAASDQRSHLHLFTQARRPYQPAEGSAAYAAGGFYFLRAGDLYVACRCGDVGIYGRGCHAHNDLLAFELCCGDQAVVVDPGSYLYTADPHARNRFRSTAMHSTLALDAAEQNEIRTDRLFAMVDRARAEALRWETSASQTTFVGCHHGFAHLDGSPVHVRTLTLDAQSASLEIIDEVHSDAPHDLAMRLTFSPEARITVSGTLATVELGHVCVRVESDGLVGAPESGEISPAYGRLLPAPRLALRGRSTPGQSRTRVRVTVVRV